MNDEQIVNKSFRVFHAEQMFSRTQTYHKKCFSCNTCKRPLDSVLACDAPDKEIYCRGCYGKKFGAKGYGFAGGAGGLQTGDLLVPIRKRLILLGFYYLAIRVSPTDLHWYKIRKLFKETRKTRRPVPGVVARCSMQRR